jgi:hypothetical protein
MVALAAACSYGTVLEVEIAVGSADPPYPFVFRASGPAVEAGLFCSKGVVEESDLVAGRLRNAYVCADGSGTLVAETFVGAGRPAEPAHWTIVSAAARYEGVSGSGSHRHLGADEIEADRSMDAGLQVITARIEDQ